MKIVLAEDDDILNELITDFLKNDGYFVKSFKDGNKTYEYLKNEKLDILILDINLPGIDGLTILKKLQKQKISPHTIIISAINDIEHINKAYELGCYDYIKKPFYLQELLIKRLEKDIHPDNKVFVTLSRLHTHETAGISVASYLAALEAGVDGIDLAAAPVSSGTSQPDMITLLHAVKGKPYNLGDLTIEKVLAYEKTLKECLKDYFFPPEATQVNPIIPLSPMPGGALTANTQMMRDNNILYKFNDVIKAIREVVEKGGYVTSVTPVSQFYWQQAFNNVIFGHWKKIAPGYGRMVLGYFGKTPVKPDEEIINLASEQLNLEPTTENPLNIADRNERKTIAYWKNLLEKEGIETTEENIFIAASCQEKGIAFLKGESPLMIRKKGEEMAKNEGIYTVIVDGEVFNVEVESPVPGNVWKILVNPWDKVNAGDKLMILESMKMEIDIPSPVSGIVAHIPVKVNDSVNEGDILATIQEA